MSDFPVLTVSATEDIDRDDWAMTVTDGISSKSYDWDQLHQLPNTTITSDIHCVTHWTKFDTVWSGVRVNTLFEDAGLGDYDFASIGSYGATPQPPGDRSGRYRRNRRDHV
ncbi:MAG: molybdopterin-dependent oxidoreductase [Acidimicrobiales bacterium]